MYFCYGSRAVQLRSSIDSQITKKMYKNLIIGDVAVTHKKGKLLPPVADSDILGQIRLLRCDLIVAQLHGAVEHAWLSDHNAPIIVRDDQRLFCQIQNRPTAEINGQTANQSSVRLLLKIADNHRCGESKIIHALYVTLYNTMYQLTFLLKN